MGGSLVHILRFFVILSTVSVLGRGLGLLYLGDLSFFGNVFPGHL